ncbi:MAG: hypothetical protein A2847_01370 [Candidatus Sungbacteria bacterium RIFCSPHIGHO2_01_FULL_50_25]|uniref:Pseudouridine synthase n=1 Tax=Candidatus Sungbacteria bacterium RIFCSPHIGHO2_01_FULL_50_25 TaxID=1802265 RepID=A0A1G2K6K7_9BACT|nr:MAG: hypothetical protein A2847_01370 [Candidatus Sungbacteria bacterium RIFCSPHIGHO2_01_FULL_50_25]
MKMQAIPILFEDTNLIVLNKPAGIAVHGGPNVKGITVVDFLVRHFPEVKSVGDDPVRPGIVHRLDKDTSGIMVVARNPDAFGELKSLFKERRIEKTYLAVVCGRPKSRVGIISYSIGRDAKNPTRRGAGGGRAKIRGEREAETHYRVLKTGGAYSLLEVTPKTGRTHQIRVHLKAIGYPIACDRVYGGKNVCCPEGAGRQMLHAQSLSFSFPEGRRIKFEADPPDDFILAMEKIL